MNILFIYARVIDSERGGVQRVTNVLSDYFESKGNKVWYITLHDKEGGKSHPSRQLFLPNAEEWDCEENKLFLSRFIKENNISICVNQHILYDKSAQCNINLAAKEGGCAMVCVYHNSLMHNTKHRHLRQGGTIFEITKTYLFKILFIFGMKKVLYLYCGWRNKRVRIFHKKAGEIYDVIVLLSKHYISEYFYLTLSYRNLRKIKTIPNPCSFGEHKFSPSNITDKQKEIIYVGRIDNGQKRIDLLLQVWALLWRKHQDWKLTIVGDGQDMKACMDYSKELDLQNISFEGEQDPIKYYQRASILCMTSRFEGYPMVLPEAMHFSVVPIVFSSYPAVTDIICDHKDGILVKPFNINEYVEKLEMLMKNDTLRRQLSNAAKEKSKQFSIEVIGNQWIQLFENLQK